MNNIEKRQLIDELHRPARRNFQRRHVIIKGLNDLWQADLVEMGAYSRKNKGYRYLLTVINTFSKYAWAIPIKSKSGLVVTEAMRKILSQQQQKPPKH